MWLACVMHADVSGWPVYSFIIFYFNILISLYNRKLRLDHGTLPLDGQP